MIRSKEILHPVSFTHTHQPSAQRKIYCMHIYYLAKTCSFLNPHTVPTAFSNLFFFYKTYIPSKDITALQKKLPPYMA